MKRSIIPALCATVLAVLLNGMDEPADVVEEVIARAGGWELPAGASGRWRDVLTGEEYDLPDGATLGGVLGPAGRALLERVA